jgi:hypothetical protein
MVEPRPSTSEGTAEQGPGRPAASRDDPASPESIIRRWCYGWIQCILASLVVWSSCTSHFTLLLTNVDPLPGSDATRRCSPASFAFLTRAAPPLLVPLSNPLNRQQTASQYSLDPLKGETPLGTLWASHLRTPFESSIDRKIRVHAAIAHVSSKHILCRSLHSSLSPRRGVRHCLHASALPPGANPLSKFRAPPRPRYNHSPRTAEASSSCINFAP